jgi:hypothetical protein
MIDVSDNDQWIVSDSFWSEKYHKNGRIIDNMIIDRKKNWKEICKANEILLMVWFVWQFDYAIQWNKIKGISDGENVKPGLKEIAWDKR